MNPDYEDDDVFYAELRRQILLLTADEDEDVDFLDKKHRNCSRASNRRSNNLTSIYSALQPAGSYFNWWEFEKSNSVPTWLVNLWRTGNGNGNGNGSGTGVFIPHTVKSRRYKTGRTRNERRISRQVKN